MLKVDHFILIDHLFDFVMPFYKVVFKFPSIYQVKNIATLLPEKQLRSLREPLTSPRILLPKARFLHSS